HGRPRSVGYIRSRSDDRTTQRLHHGALSGVNMKAFLILAFILVCCPGPALWAQASLVGEDSSRSSVENRLESPLSPCGLSTKTSPRLRERCSTTRTASV